MGIQVRDSKLFLVSAMVILVIIVSGFGYGYIAREEVRTGGMGEKWHMATSGEYGLDMNAMRPDGSLLMVDGESHIISLVDQNGVVEWSHDFGSYLAYTEVLGDDLYMIAVSEDGNHTLDHISMDGVWKSSMPCPPIYSFTLGSDGPTCALGYDNDGSSLYKIEGGSINWSYVQNGSLGIFNVMDDGRLLLHHIKAPFDSNEYDVNEMIMISSNGTPEWKQSFPPVGGYYGVSTATVADNGTIIMVRQYNSEGLVEVKLSRGYSDSGDLFWATNESIDYSKGTSPYFTSDPMAGNMVSVTMVDPIDISKSWNVILTETSYGSVYVLPGMEIFVSSDGQAYGLDLNGSILWHIDTLIPWTQLSETNDDLGLLLRSDIAILKIGKDGSFWVYDMADSSIRDARFGPYSTVYVTTSDKMVVLYKPTVSTPTEYLITMLSVDLLIALSSGLWIIDRVVKKPN